MVTSAIDNPYSVRVSILVRPLNQNLLIGALVAHPRLDQKAENEYGKGKCECYCNPEPTVAQYISSCSVIFLLSTVMVSLLAKLIIYFFLKMNTVRRMTSIQV
jgi:hypothetical protein